MSPEMWILIAGALVGLATAPLGLFLVLRGQAMLTDAVAHSVLPGIVLVWLATGLSSGLVPMAGAALAGVVTVLATGALQRSGLVAADAAVGLVFPAMFALGVLLINLFARDVHLDADTVLLGEIGLVWLKTLVVGGQEVPEAVMALGVVLLVNLGFVLAFWKELVLGSFDPALAQSLGLRPGMLHLVLLGLTAMTAVAAFEAVGVILFIAFAIVPSATALLLTGRPTRALGLAMVLAVVAAALGQGIAFRLDVSIGGMMAVVAGAIFALAVVLAPGRGVVARLRRRRAELADHAARTLVTHLLAHEDQQDAAEECSEAALSGHLRWPADHAARVILQGLDRGLVLRDGPLLRLTPKGRAVAQAILDPIA